MGCGTCVCLVSSSIGHAAAGPTNPQGGQGHSGAEPGAGVFEHGHVLMLTQSNRINGSFAKGVKACPTVVCPGMEEKVCTGTGSWKARSPLFTLSSTGKVPEVAATQLGAGTTPRPQRSPDGLRLAQGEWGAEGAL